VVGAFYYLRIVKVMYFDEPAGTFDAMPTEVGVVLAVSTALVLLFVVLPSPLVRAANAAALSLF
jgi:NADH-quinone oxidoreductase subunit N